MSETLETDVSLNGCIKAVYRLLKKDDKGLEYKYPVLHVSIDGSPWFPVEQIMSTGGKILNGEIVLTDEPS